MSTAAADETLDISVVLPTYNRSALLATCLRSFVEQETPAGLRWEVVVVDNNCTDDTPATVERAREGAPMPIQYVVEAKQGVAFGRNTGVQHARGRLIAFTDDDVTAPPNWIAGVLGAFVEHSADAVGGRVLPRWAAPVPAWVDEWLRERQYRHTHLGILAHAEQVEITAETAYPPIWTANAAVKRQVFLKLGGLDTRMGRVEHKLYGGDDTDFIRRVAASGLRVVYDPRLVVYHRIPAERMTRRHFRRLRFEDAEGEGLHVSPPRGRAFLGVRWYTYRRVARNFAVWAAAAGRRRRDAFARELDLQSALGQLWGELKAARGHRHERRP